MKNKQFVSGDEAIALGVKLAKPHVIAAYPITPQTITVERLADYVEDGSLNSEYIFVESEHSALSACLGASAMGSRTFTATSSQGFALYVRGLTLCQRLTVTDCNDERKQVYSCSMEYIRRPARFAFTARYRLDSILCRKLPKKLWIQLYKAYRIAKDKENYDSGNDKI